MAMFTVFIVTSVTDPMLSRVNLSTRTELDLTGSWETRLNEQADVYFWCAQAARPWPCRRGGIAVGAMDSVSARRYTGPGILFLRLDLHAKSGARRSDLYVVQIGYCRRLSHCLPVCPERDAYDGQRQEPQRVQFVPVDRNGV